MGFGEVYTALQSKVIDGAENNEMALTSNGHGDVCKYYSYDMHQMIPDILIGNCAFMDALSEDEREIFEEGFKLINSVEREEWVKAVEAAKDKAENQQGVNFLYPDTKPFQETCKSMHTEMLESYPDLKPIYDRIQVHNEQHQTEEEAEGKYDWKNLGMATLRALPALSLIVIVIGGIVIGVFTATEGSAIAVVYALVLGIFYKNITVKSFWNIVVDSAKMSGMVVFLIGVSNILGWVMAFMQIPQAVSAALLGLTDNYILILLIMNVILLIAGTFMDVTPAILIFTPLFLPIVQTFGMHPVHFGLILVYNLCIGNITPPVGNTLFVAIKVGNTSLAKTIPYMLWYYAAILIGLLLITYVPFLSTGLPIAAGLI